MTLSVDASWIDDDGTEHVLPIKSSIAGAESSRHTFSAGPQAIKKGLHLLPRLRELAYIEVGVESFDVLLSEIKVLEAVARESGTYESYWRFRLDNLRDAVAAASSHRSTGKVTLG